MCQKSILPCVRSQSYHVSEVNLTMCRESILPCVRSQSYHVSEANLTLCKKANLTMCRESILPCVRSTILPCVRNICWTSRHRGKLWFKVGQTFLGLRRFCRQSRRLEIVLGSKLYKPLQV